MIRGLGSLRALTAVFLVAFFVATSLTGYFTWRLAHDTIERLVDRRIASVSDELLSGRRGDPEAILAQIAALSRQRDTGDIGFELEDRAGRRLGGNVAIARALPAGYSTLAATDGIAGLSAGRALVRSAGRELRLTTIVETEPIDEYAAARVRNNAVGFGIIILVVLVGTVLFAQLVSRRIAEVRGTAQAIIAGDLSRRVPVDPHGGAFADQARTFNAMLDRIAALMGEISSVSNDIAHDLRTPLARLRSQLAMMAARADAGSLAEEIEAAIVQCDTLLAMFAAALRIAEVEAGARRASFAPVALDALAREIAETMAPVAEEDGRALTLDPLDAVTVSGDRQLLSQAAMNLVENALRHTPVGTAIRVSVADEGATAVLRISDDGPGVAAGDRALALRRFGRLDASRHTAGHGLGLALVDAVARLHGGELVLGDAAPGLTASLILPRAQAV